LRMRGPWQRCSARAGTRKFSSSRRTAIHRIKAVLSARDQLVRNKRTFFGQIRDLLRPFGIRLASRQGTKRFDEAAQSAVCQDDLLYACVNALLEALAAIEMQIAALDRQVRTLTQRSETCWRMRSVPGVGPVTALDTMVVTAPDGLKLAFGCYNAMADEVEMTVQQILADIAMRRLLGASSG
jgi:transposase